MSDLLEQFHICENRCSHLDPNTIKEYFPDGGFDHARDVFFKVVEADVKKFYDLPYPFVGRIVFDGNVFKNLVRIIPEFIVSIIKTGMPAIITLGEFEIYEENDPVQLSHKNLLHASELVIESANLLNTIGLENRTPALKKRLNNKLRLLQINKSHYDLLGILQSIHNSTVLAANSMNLLEPGINHLYFHADQKKRAILYSIVGPILNPLRTVATLGAGTEINAVKPLILAEIEKNGLALANPNISGNYPLLSDLPAINIEENISSLYGSVDGLVLHLPEDQTSDQSSVYLDIMSSNKKIADIMLSHMEAAFLFYLGAELQANESHWLHEPENHKPTLQKIWNSFALPQHFETELEMTSPTKGSTSTWIWDFRNVNRKTLRNQIHRKIKVLRLDALDFDLITSIKPKSSSRCGIYKLNNQIKSFKIIPPPK